MAKFEDNSQEFLQRLHREIAAWMEETTGLLEANAVKKSRTDSGQTKGSYQHKVLEDASAYRVEGYVGSNYENAIWEEFGTGEYALGGDGRKTPWVYRNRKGEYYWTTGKKPNRTLQKAYQAYNRKKMLQALEDRLNKAGF